MTKNKNRKSFLHTKKYQFLSAAAVALTIASVGTPLAQEHLFGNQQQIAKADFHDHIGPGDIDTLTGHQLVEFRRQNEQFEGDTASIGADGQTSSGQFISASFVVPLSDAFKVGPTRRIYYVFPDGHKELLVEQRTGYYRGGYYDTVTKKVAYWNNWAGLNGTFVNGVSYNSTWPDYHVRGVNNYDQDVTYVEANSNPTSDEEVDVHLSSPALNISPENPRSDGNGADYSDLHKTVTRTIYLTDPHTGTKAITQSVHFKRGCTYDPNAQKVSKYDAWTADGTTTWPEYDVPAVAGYIPSQTKVSLQPVSASDSNQTVNIDYRANAQSFKIHYQDEKTGKEVGSQTVKGNTDDEVSVTPELPKGYHLVNKSDVPSKITMSASPQDMTVKVSNLETIDPNNPGDHKGVYASSLHKSVHRTVNVTDPHTGKTTTTKQTVNFKRTASYNASTESVESYGPWEADGDSQFAAVNVPNVPGYTPSAEAPAETPAATDPDKTIDVTYTANDQSMNIIYQTKDGKEVGRTTVKGKTDETVPANAQVPEGYELAAGQTLPKDITFKGAKTDDVIMKVVKVDKAELAKAISNGQAAQKGDKYAKAGDAVKKALDDALAAGQKVNSDPKATQEQVNTAAKAINDAIDALDHAAKANLEEEVKKGHDAVNGDKYPAATDAHQKALQDAIAKGEEIVKDPSATQKQIDDATQAIQDAIDQIDQDAKKGLKDDVAKGEADQKGDKYQNSTPELKKALDNALDHAKQILNNPNATKKDIDDADNAIKTALKGIDDNAKTGMNDSIKKGQDAQKGDKYDKASDADKKALDDAVKKAQDVAKDPNASQKDIDDAKKGIEDAINKIDQDAKKDLKDDVAKGEAEQKSDKYQNSTPDLKKALDNAVSQGQKVLNDPNATQKQIDDADKAIKDALKGIDDNAKTGLNDDIKKGQDAQKGNEYKDASDADKKGLDNAIKKAQDVAKDPNASQKDIDDAKKGIEDAINKIDQDAKKDLNDALKNGEAVQKGDKYQAATDAEKKALDDAIKKGEDVAKNPNAAKKDIQDATKAINDAINAIDKNAKKDLDKTLSQATDGPTKDKLPNVSDDTKKAFNDALDNAQKVDKDPDSTKKQIDDANDALKKAMDNVDKEAKKGLEDSIKKGEDAKNSKHYQDASDAKKKALDDALDKAKKVDANSDASQAAIDNAKKALDDASADIDGVANKDDLNKALDAAKKAQSGDDYKGATDAAKKALDDAIKKGEDVAKDSDANQKQVDNATKALKDATDGLAKNKKPADKTDLNKDIDNANKVKNSDAYKNANDDAKKAFDDALKKAQDVAKDPNATQKQVDDAAKALKDATDGLSKNPKNTADKSNLNKAIDDAKDVKDSDAYKNASDEAKKAFDDALQKAEDVANDPNATQDDIDNATKALQDAIDGLSKNQNGDSNNNGTDDNNNSSSTTGDNGQSGSDNAGSTTGNKGGQSGKTTGNQGGTLPQTGKFVMQHARALAASLIAMMAALGGWLFKRHKDDEKKGLKKIK